MSPMDLKELKRKLEIIRQQGFVKTHRVGDTGIGKTLEDLQIYRKTIFPCTI